MGALSHRSSGGIASVDFNLGELERARGLLGRSAEELGGAAGCLDGSLLSLGMLALSGDAVVAASAEWGLRRASLLTRGAQLHVGAVGQAVEHSRAAYAEAEHRVQRAVNDARAAMLPLILAHDLHTNNYRPRTATTQDLVNQSPALVGTILPLLFPASFPVASQLGRLRDKAHGGTFETSVAERLYPRLAGVASSLDWVDIGPLEIVGASSRADVPFTGSMGELMSLQGAAEAGSAGAGALLVTTVQTANGPVHVLTLPGTQPGDGRGPAGTDAANTEDHRTNPWDEGGVVEGMGLGSQHVAAAALEALERVGARPGDALVLTGYSQGGIHAANLAVDHRLAGEYNVEYVVTAGSPVGGTTLPADVRGLQLEHVDDPVPGTDGATNANGRNQVTVYLDGYAAGIDRRQGGFGAAHDLRNYSGQTADVVRSGDPAVAEANAALGAVFAGASTATVHTLRLRRTGGGSPRRGAGAEGAPRSSRAPGPPSR